MGYGGVLAQIAGAPRQQAAQQQQTLLQLAQMRQNQQTQQAQLSMQREELGLKKEKFEAEIDRYQQEGKLKDLQAQLDIGARFAQQAHAAFNSGNQVLAQGIWNQGLTKMNELGYDTSKYPTPAEITPEGLASYVQGSMTAKDYIASMAPKEVVTSELVAGPGGSLIEKKTDQDGRVVGYESVVGREGKGVTVQTGMQETAEAKELGKLLVEDYKGTIESADVATAQLPNLEIAKSMLVDRALETGAAEELKLNVARYMEAAGIQPPAGFSDIQTAEQFRANMSQVELSVLAQQKGTQSETDAKRVSKAMASIEKDEQANIFILDTMIATANRSEDKAKFYAQFRRDNGTLDGAREAWNSEMERLPMLINMRDGRILFHHDMRQKALDSGMTLDEFNMNWEALNAQYQ